MPRTGTATPKWTDEELGELFSQYQEAGWQIASKQLSDESLDQVLAALGVAQAQTPRTDHRLEHASELRADQVDDVAEAGLYPIVQFGGLEADLQFEEGFIEQTTDDGVGALWPWRTMLASGIPIVGSIAVAPRSATTMSVMQMVHGAVTGISEVGNAPWAGRDEQLLTVETGAARVDGRRRRANGTYRSGYGGAEHSSRALDNHEPERDRQRLASGEAWEVGGSLVRRIITRPDVRSAAQKRSSTRTLRTAVEGHGGVVFKHTGDGMCDFCGRRPLVRQSHTD